MRKIKLGRTGLYATEVSFGALPIQRISRNDARELLRFAYERGVNFFDTANFYTDSEEKIGYALSDVRHDIIIATKSATDSVEFMQKNLEQSLRMMKTDYIDIFQLHNPSTTIYSTSSTRRSVTVKSALSALPITRLSLPIALLI